LAIRLIIPYLNQPQVIGTTGDPTNGIFWPLKPMSEKKLDFSKLCWTVIILKPLLLSQLYFEKAAIKDVPMPAFYGERKIGI